MYLLCFVAVASVALRAEPGSPLFGGTANGVFDISLKNQSLPNLTEVSTTRAQVCNQHDCQNVPNAAIHTAANAVQP